MRLPSAGSEGGFALLEAVLALAIVAMVNVAVLAHLGADLRALARLREVLPAVAMAEHRMAYLHLVDPTELEHLPDSLAHGRFEAPLEHYQWTAEVEPVRGQPGLYDAEVVVRWDGGGSLPLRSRLYRPPRRGPGGVIVQPPQSQ